MRSRVFPQPAAIVALRPSTGAVLAVAQNAPADAQGAIALTCLYPPGSTFKTVTTSAALQAGKVTPDTVLPCPGTENIEGRQIPNDDNFDLGSVPLHSAFAHSCNTPRWGAWRCRCRRMRCNRPRCSSVSASTT